MGLTSRFELVGGYSHILGNLTGAGAVGGTSQPAGVTVFADGTAAGQANFVYENNFTLAATTMLNLDMKGGGGELDLLNRAMAATAIKAVLLQITTPASGTSLRFGPQNQSNAAQLWFQAVTANFYQEVFDILWVADPRAGWSLDATHKVLSIYNPGASSVDARLRVIGTK